MPKGIGFGHRAGRLLRLRATRNPLSETIFARARVERLSQRAGNVPCSRSQRPFPRISYISTVYGSTRRCFSSLGKGAGEISSAAESPIIFSSKKDLGASQSFAASKTPVASELFPAEINRRGGTFNTTPNRKNTYIKRTETDQI